VLGEVRILHAIIVNWSPDYRMIWCEIKGIGTEIAKADIVREHETIRKNRLICLVFYRFSK
jgi:hypothetical protein